MSVYLDIRERLEILVESMGPLGSQTIEIREDIDSDGQDEVVTIEPMRDYYRIKTQPSSRGNTTYFAIPKPSQRLTVSYDEDKGQLKVGDSTFQVYGETNEDADLLMIGRAMVAYLPPWIIEAAAHGIDGRPLDIVYGGSADYRDYLKGLKKKGLMPTEFDIEGEVKKHEEADAALVYQLPHGLVLLIHEHQPYFAELVGEFTRNNIWAHELGHLADAASIMNWQRPHYISGVAFFDNTCLGFQYYMNEVEACEAYPSTFVQGIYDDPYYISYRAHVEYAAEMHALRMVGAGSATRMRSHPEFERRFFPFQDVLFHSHGDTNVIASICEWSADILGVQE